ncbi:MAG: abortive infection system antitoxin AbiGi family protein [Planctomycetota bacterium]|nr:abortive infection system antitoxin AbiGi family protein [Planctomycetota bacterium]
MLEKIIKERKLLPGEGEVSDVKYGGKTTGTDAPKKKYFRAVCFTETPLNEVHSLLDISYRSVNLSRYGLVFLKDRLQKKGVCPVFYVNNESGDMDDVFQALFSLIESHPDSAAKMLPLFAAFGQKVQAPGAASRPEGRIDFRWEREWRYASVFGELTFTQDDVFVGLCPDKDIGYFEGLFEGVGFIDPQRNMKYYAKKLIEARQRVDLKYSVV